MPEMHGRLPWLEPGHLSEAQRQVYEGIRNGPRGQGPSRAPLADDRGRLEGPFNAMVLGADTGEALQALGSSIRYRTGFSGREREAAILRLSVLERCDFEWVAHERVGESVGLSAAEMSGLRHGQVAATFSQREQVILNVVEALWARGDLDDTLFAQAVSALALPGVVDLVVLVGYYQLLALSLRTFRTPLPIGTEPVFVQEGTD